jgi:hypothetical protein
MRVAIESMPDGVVGWAAKEHRMSTDKDGTFVGRVRQSELKNRVVGLQEISGKSEIRIMREKGLRDEIPLLPRGEIFYNYRAQSTKPQFQALYQSLQY